MTDKRRKKPGPPKGVRIGGRQAGTPNKVNAATRERIVAEVDPIGFMASVMRGDAIKSDVPQSEAVQYPTLEQRIHAARWLGNKITPDAKDKPVTFNLPEINNIKDLSVASLAVLTAVGAGEITPSEAQALSSVLVTSQNVLQGTEFLERLEALERGRTR